ncbi:GAF and ANTAR domain-containing protein [Kitasatospora sp. NPDC059571]|uniref:GAF and ANTAR domain-containing protein n=1 Tax=Kitasatospora sp. NPDC059571 TaxID=3346871 RepID=UPI00369E2CCA
MISDLMARTLPRLRRRAGALDLDALHSVERGALGVDCLAVSLLTDTGRREPVWCSDALGRRFEDLEFTLGEGPSGEAAIRGRPVLVPDLARIRSERWPALAIESAPLPVRAVFCFPLGVGAIHVGALTAARRTRGPLTGPQTDDALVLAAALTSLCLAFPDQASGGPEDSPALLRAVVHQATGMLSVHLGIPLPEALAMLRAHAFVSGIPVGDISQDIVDRRLRLGENEGEE